MLDITKFTKVKLIEICGLFWPLNHSNNQLTPGALRRPLYTRGKQPAYQKGARQPLRSSTYMGCAHNGSFPRKTDHSSIRRLGLSKGVRQHFARSNEHHLPLSPSDCRIKPGRIQHA